MNEISFQCGRLPKTCTQVCTRSPLITSRALSHANCVFVATLQCVLREVVKDSLHEEEDVLVSSLSRSLASGTTSARVACANTSHVPLDK